MTGDELQVFVKGTEVIFRRTEDNIFEFPTGRQLGIDEVNALMDLENVLAELELVLSD